MKISAKVIEDSVSTELDGYTNSAARLTTMELVYPRYILAELNTHRMLSKNSASSRAIPIKKTLKQVWSNPVIPVAFGSNKPGMQAGAELTGFKLRAAKFFWILASKVAVVFAWTLMKLGLHKQLGNRILEPWQWMTTIVTGTKDAYANLYHLRIHPDAQPEFKALAEAMYKAHRASKPKVVGDGKNDWHLPYIQWYEKLDLKNGLLHIDDVKKMSVARCARVSYLNHDGSTPNREKDLKLHDMLIKAPHASPFEHVAKPALGRHANFIGWKQYRKELPNENHTEYEGI